MYPIMTSAEPTTDYICLRQGYQCKCPQCQIWIDRWSKELDAFVTIDSMMCDGKSLFQIYERLRVEHPDILRLHHRSIEQHYFEHKTVEDKEREPKKNSHKTETTTTTTTTSPSH